MTVKELIEELKEMAPEAEILRLGGCDEPYFLESVRKVRAYDDGYSCVWIGERGVTYKNDYEVELCFD